MSSLIYTDISENQGLLGECRMNEEITVDRHDLRFVNDISQLSVLIKLYTEARFIETGIILL